MLWQMDLDSLINSLTNQYMKLRGLKKADSSLSKITAKINLQDAKKIDKILRNNNYKHELNTRILIINFIISLPSILGLKLVKLLRLLLKR